MHQSTPSLGTDFATAMQTHTTGMSSPEATSVGPSSVLSVLKTSAITAGTYSWIDWYSGRASYWGDAYTVRKWTRNLRTKIRNAYQRKEIEERMPHFKSTFTNNFIKRFSKIKGYSQTMRGLLLYTRVCSVVVHVMFCLRRLETESRFIAYGWAHHFHDFRTARYLCVLYAEICVKLPLLVKSMCSRKLRSFALMFSSMTLTKALKSQRTACEKYEQSINSVIPKFKKHSPNL